MTRTFKAELLNISFRRTHIAELRNLFRLVALVPLGDGGHLERGSIVTNHAPALLVKLNARLCLDVAIGLNRESDGVVSDSAGDNLLEGSNRDIESKRVSRRNHESHRVTHFRSDTLLCRAADGRKSANDREHAVQHVVCVLLSLAH